MAYMPSDPHEGNEVHNLDDVNSRLYRRDLADRKPKHMDVLHSRRFPIQKEWANIGEAKGRIARLAHHPSFFKKFFFFAIGFAVLALIIAFVTFFTGGNTVSNSNIEINVLGTSFAAGGEELPIQVEVINKNSSPLELADLFVEYDKGGDASGGASRVRELNSLGTIPAGKSITKSFFITLYGQEGSTKNIDFTLQYRLHGSNAIFVKENTFPVTISSSPISLTIEGPSTMTPNQPLTLTVKTRSNSKNALSGLLLHVEYPNGFKFSKSTPSATAFNNVWDLGDLAPGAERSITIEGTVFGVDGEDQAFHLYTGAVSAKDNTKIGITYNSVLHTIALVKPFISAHLSINGSTANTVPVSSGTTINGHVNYANNLPTQVTSAEITLSLSGNALDTSSIVASRGFYDSTKRTITWNSTTDPDLASIQPSDSGGLDFSFRVLPLLSTGRPISQPSIKLSVSIKGKQPALGGDVSEVTDFEEKTAVVSSDLGFSADAFYSTGPFSNTGPIPPVANQPTTYTVVWTITNSANALADGYAAASLPPYVEWVGTVSPSTEPIEYDKTTSAIRWRIGQIPIGTGLSAAPRRVSFQVRLNPSTSQVGSIPKLVLDSTITARDTFTGETLTISRQPLSTLLQNDPGFPPGGAAVTQ